MTIAKYAYILDKVFKIPTLYTFDRWHLGPYPPEMKKTVLNKKFFTKNRSKLDLVNAEQLLKYHNPYKENIAVAISELADIFLGFPDKERSRQTELLATVCKVVEDINSTDLGAVRQSMAAWPIDLQTSTFKNKAEKFTEEEINTCLRFIIDKGWDKFLI